MTYLSEAQTFRWFGDRCQEPADRCKVEQTQSDADNGGRTDFLHFSESANYSKYSVANLSPVLQIC